MPVYEYMCSNCGYSFERLESFSADKNPVCPQCGGTAERLLSMGTGIVMGSNESRAYDPDRGGNLSCNRTSPCCGREVPCDERPCD